MVKAPTLAGGWVSTSSSISCCNYKVHCCSWVVVITVLLCAVVGQPWQAVSALQESGGEPATVIAGLAAGLHH